jgi:hypothetical protein
MARPLGRELREQKKQDAWRMYLDDISRVQIAKTLGITRRTVYELLKEKREEEREYADIHHDFTDDFHARHVQTRGRLTQMMTRLNNRIIQEEQREEVIEAVIQAHHQQHLEGDGSEEEDAESDHPRRGRPSVRRSLQEEAGVLVMSTRAHELMMSAPRSLAALTEQYTKSLHDEAEAFGLIGRGRQLGANPAQIEAIKALLDDDSGPDNPKVPPAPRVESWPKEWEPETPVLPEGERTIAKA